MPDALSLNTECKNIRKHHSVYIYSYICTISIKMESKINQLLQTLPKGVVVLASWLTKQGYSHTLQQQYIQSGWLESIGQGAFKRSGDKVSISGALYALQCQANKDIHIGGLSALAMQGYAHYVEMEQRELILISSQGYKLPAWFTRYHWGQEYKHRQTNLLPANIAISTDNSATFEVRISSPARAMLECLDMVPTQFDINEAWIIMEGLGSLQPRQVQTLLEQCKSVKAKRLFLHFAEKANHSWFRHLKTENISLGKGKRSIIKGGVLIPKYQIIIPETLA